MSDALDKLSMYQESASNILKGIYANINKEAAKYLQEDLTCGLNVLNWLQETSKNTGDSDVKQRLTSIVCNLFKELVYKKIDNNLKRSNWAAIKRTDFYANVAGIISDINTLRENEANIRLFTPADIAALIPIYLDAASKTDTNEQNVLRVLFTKGLKDCYRNNDTNSLKEIASVLPQKKSFNIQDELFLELEKSKDEGYSEYIINYIISCDTSIISSDESMLSFCEKLKNEPFEYLNGTVIKKRIDKLNKPSEIDAFIKTIRAISFKSTGENALSHIFTLLGEKFKLNTIIEYLVKSKFTIEELSFVFEALYLSSEEYFSGYIKEIISTANKNRDKWNALFVAALKKRDENVLNIIIQVLADTRQSEKSLAALHGLLEDKNTQKYFEEITKKAQEVMSAQKPKSVLSAIFGGKTQI